MYGILTMVLFIFCLIPSSGGVVPVDPGGAFSIRIQIQGIPQPTNAQAAAEANANVDVGHTKSATTKWFVAVFSGFAHAGNNYVTPVDFDGFPENKNTNENAIIKFARRDYAKAHNSTCRSPMSCNCPSAEVCFWDAFRKIASDPVGRVLLYRILIEISRNTEANDVQAVAGVVNQHGNVLKHLVVSYSPNPKDAYYKNGQMKFSNKPMLGQQLLNKLHRRNNNYEICVKEDIKTNIVDITLIHEFLHWFHHLRSRVRYENYGAGRQANANAIVQGLSLVQHAVTSGMFNNIAGINNPARINRSQTPWLNNSGQCDFEEILTILGRDTVTRGNEYLEGDDLSENAYRISCNRRGGKLPHRFGHSTFAFLEDMTVLNYSTNVADNCVASIVNPGVNLAPANGNGISPNIRYQENLHPFDNARGMNYPRNAGLGNSFFTW